MFEIVVLDCLKALEKGEELKKFGDVALLFHLPGAPYAYLAYDFLRRNHLIWPLHGQDDPVERWVLSNKGYYYLCRMSAWYQALPLWHRALARLGLAEDRALAVPEATVWQELH
ncbi:hypothetical protein [Telmatospirillum sp. J64-1]|uniref:hypothetical protein n=1 Tax=Telmatospirillum sp. J64-1 TaxID=2502183 RepID=UPI00115E13DE|nr:hypothetical protein [Telmatospirillum sp. J64-1]